MQEDVARSWLQDPLKRKLVDFAWNRRFFYLPGACSPFFGYTRLIVLINPIFLSGAPVLINHPVSLGLTRGNRKGGGGAKTKKKGEKGGGGRRGKKNEKSACFLFEASCSQRQMVSVWGGLLHVNPNPPLHIF